jgi:hypothetical protein
MGIGVMYKLAEMYALWYKLFTADDRRDSVMVWTVVEYLYNVCLLCGHWEMLLTWYLYWKVDQ